MKTHGVIRIGKDTAIPARFIALITTDQSPGALDNIWNIRIILTDRLPAIAITFRTEQEAWATFTQTVKALEEYYAE